jgi:hypothetical protein
LLFLIVCYCCCCFCFLIVLVRLVADFFLHFSGFSFDIKQLYIHCFIILIQCTMTTIKRLFKDTYNFLFISFENANREILLFHRLRNTKELLKQCCTILCIINSNLVAMETLFWKFHRYVVMDFHTHSLSFMSQNDYITRESHNMICKNIKYMRHNALIMK